MLAQQASLTKASEPSARAKTRSDRSNDAQQHSAYANPDLAQTAALQAKANRAPTVQRLQNLQRKANGRDARQDATQQQTSEARTDPTSALQHVLPTPPTHARPNAGQSLGFAGAGASFGAAPIQRKRGTLRGATTLQTQNPPTGKVQHPALIGAKNTPVQNPVADQMGATVTQMSRKDYHAWRGSWQAQSAPHGVMHQGDRSTVARWQAPGSVLQQIKFPLTPKMKAGLVMAEASLTIIAGIGGLVAGVGFGAVPLVVPSILGLIVGALKFTRGALMWGEKAPEGKKLAVIDTLRTIEALVAGVGALLADPTSFFKIPAMIFAITKLLRSLATALADLMEAKGWSKSPLQKAFIKGLKLFSALAHAVEVATAGFSAGAGLVMGGAAIAEGGAEAATGTAQVIAGVGGLGIAGTKDVRTADQFLTADKIKGQGGADAVRDPPAQNVEPDGGAGGSEAAEEAAIAIGSTVRVGYHVRFDVVGTVLDIVPKGDATYIEVFVDRCYQPGTTEDSDSPDKSIVMGQALKWKETSCHPE